MSLAGKNLIKFWKDDLLLATDAKQIQKLLLQVIILESLMILNTDVSLSLISDTSAK